MPAPGRATVVAARAFNPTRTPPRAPRNVTVTRSQGGGATVSWSAPSEEYSVAGYTVKVVKTNGQTTIQSASSSPLVAPGSVVAQCGSYKISVGASDSNGVTKWSRVATANATSGTQSTVYSWPGVQLFSQTGATAQSTAYGVRSFGTLNSTGGPPGVSQWLGPNSQLIINSEAWLLCNAELYASKAAQFNAMASSTAKPGLYVQLPLEQPSGFKEIHNALAGCAWKTEWFSKGPTVEFMFGALNAKLLWFRSSAFGPPLLDVQTGNSQGVTLSASYSAPSALSGDENVWRKYSLEYRTDYVDVYIDDARVIRAPIPNGMAPLVDVNQELVLGAPQVGRVDGVDYEFWQGKSFDPAGVRWHNSISGMKIQSL